MTGGVNSHPTTSEEANGFSTDFISEGVVGTLANTSGVAPATGGFAVNATGTPDTNIRVSAGVAYVIGTPSSQNSQTFRVKNTATAAVAIASNSSGSTKYDWVYIKLDATKLNGPDVAGDDAATLVTSRSSSQSTDDGSPPTFSYPLAVVTVANGFSTITNGNIRDVRANCIVNLGSSSVASGWLDLGFTPNTVTCNGNGSYNLVFNSTDLTSILSTGMKIKTTRSNTAPTQCTDLESTSSNYFNKTSPAGTTFTDDFAAMGWVKLESYGAVGTMVSRYNGTSGWAFQVEATGQITLVGYNAGAANFSQVKSQQAIPLGKWVHVAGQLDMSTFTSTATSSYIMINGIDVTSSVATNVSRGGTNPTALVQAGNLEVGGQNGGTLPFDGKLAQIAYFNAKITQAVMLSYISQTLSGSETSLISAYSFNNTINDLSANANNLTSQNAAVATSTDSPFALSDTGVPLGTTDYAVITSKVFSTNTTLTVQVPEGSTIPTTGGVSAVAYSTQGVPYGFPRNVDKWTIKSLHAANSSKTSPAQNTWYGDSGLSVTGPSLSVPVGPWALSWSADMQGSKTASTSYDIAGTLSTSNNSESDKELTAYTSYNGASGTLGGFASSSGSKSVTLTTTTPYYLNVSTDVATSGTIGVRGDAQLSIIKAVLTSL